MSFISMITGSVDSLAVEGAATVDSLASGQMTVIDLIQRGSQLDLSELVTSVGGEILQVMFKIALSLVIYYVGRWLICRVINFMDKGFVARDVEVSLRSFLKSMVKIILYTLLILTIIQLLGINTTSLVAMLASAGLAVGMALSGTLQNFAGGVMVLFLKPYKVGDYITAQGQSGSVKEIMLFTTVLETPDGHTIFLPNSTISSSIIDNYTHAGERRVDWSVGISYGDDFDTVKEAIMEIINADKRIIQDPKRPALNPMVGLSELADSAVNLVVRVWVKNENYWGVFFDVNEKIYKELPLKGANFPFPQMDVHIKNN